jgi:hypothetical protein
MSHAKNLTVLFILAALVAGCARFRGPSSPQPSHPKTTVELQDMNLEFLHGMIQDLDVEIAAMKAMPPSPFPLYEQLRATDLAGMEARRETLVILRDHCRLSRGLLLEVEKDPAQKPRILEEWARHKERMTILLNEADEKVRGFQRQRIRLEFEIVERTTPTTHRTPGATMAAGLT